jgi:hypothetical protein
MLRNGYNRMNYFELANFIPKVPEELIISDIQELYKRNNAFTNDRSWDWWYFTTLVDPELHDFLQPYFNFPVLIYYQLSGVQLTPHIDSGRTWCYNYTILPGGPDVKTRWYDENDNIVYQVTASLKTWYRLQVDIKHDISPIQSHRLSLSIQKAPE